MTRERAEAAACEAARSRGAAGERKEVAECSEATARRSRRSERPARRWWRLVVLALMLIAGPAAAEETLTVGLYAPSAPFESAVKRLDFAAALAQHLAPRTGASTGVGRAYGKAGDFAAAAQRGEWQVAVVDAAYLAALGTPYKVIAAAERNGASGAAWEVIAAGDARSVLDLAGKTLAVPTLGAKDDAFLTDVLLEGVLDKSHFGKVVYTPDALSALSAVEHGRADAAVVPSGLTLPAGARRIATLSSIAWPVLVAAAGTPEDRIEKIAAALSGFNGDTLTSFSRGGGDAVKALAGRFSRRAHRGPLAAPPLRVGVEDLARGRSFSITPTEISGYARAR